MKETNAHYLALVLIVSVVLEALETRPRLKRKLQESALEAGMERNDIRVMQEICAALGL